MGNINACWSKQPAETSPIYATTTAGSETSSICVTTVDTGAHNFTVANYSRLKGKGVGVPITSTPFSVGGYNWQISFYPDGIDQTHAGYASVFLRRCDGDDAAAAIGGVLTNYTLSLRVKDGKVHRASKASNKLVTMVLDFGPENRNSGEIRPFR